MLFKAYLSAVVLSAFACAASTTSCSDVMTFYARGTGEPGTIGIFVGPYLKSALERALSPRSSDLIGIDYHASLWNYLRGGDPEGARTMAANVTSAVESCPDAQIVMSGYSQGAQLVHLALEQVSSSVLARIVAVVVFGDPKRGRPFPGKLNDHYISFCHKLDGVCEGHPIIPPNHLTYSDNVGEAADFVASQLLTKSMQSRLQFNYQYDQ